MGLNSALSSSPLFHQPFLSSSSSSSHSFPAHHSFLVTPYSLKVLMHKGSSSPAPTVINLTKKSSSLFFAATSGDSTSHRELPTTACGNGAPLSPSSSAIDFLNSCHRLKIKFFLMYHEIVQRIRLERTYDDPEYPDLVRSSSSNLNTVGFTARREEKQIARKNFIRINY